MRRIPLHAFDLIEPIARGGMGLVFRGEQRAMGVPVGVKVLASARARQERAVQAFAREVRAMASLDHPAIVRILDHGVVPDEAAAASPHMLVPGSPYLVMELAHGTLDHPAPARSWARTRSVLLALLDALAHAHARGLVHRDLKPANVLRVRTRRGGSVLKLSDFGLAYVLDSDPSDERGAAAGTPQMMAPEQFRGAVRDFGPWTDLYALGCIAFKLATGVPPFDEADEERLANLHLRSEVPAMSSRFPVPAEFDAWTRRLLEKSPEARYQRAADAAHALRGLGDVDDAIGGAPRASIAARSHTTEPSAEGLAETTGFAAASAVEDARTVEDLPAFALFEDESASRGTSEAPIRVPLGDWRTHTPPPEPLWLGAALRLHGLRQPPLVGREAERDATWRALARVHAGGAPEALVLRGPSGFGKSRLAQWLFERAHETGAATTLFAFHEPFGPPEAGLERMVAAHLRTGGLSRIAVLARLRRVLPDEDGATWEALADLFAPRTRETGAAPAVRRAARVALLARFLAVESRTRPLLVWFDDVQWSADALDLVHAVLDDPERRPSILFVITAQDEALAERAQEFGKLASLLGRSDVNELELGALGREDHRALVEDLLGSTGPLAQRVAERTAGHPLFAAQLIGDWVERGTLIGTPGGLALRDGESGELPDDLHAVWARRLANIAPLTDPEARSALELLAIAGRRVDAGLFASACEHARLPYPARAVEQLLARRLLLLHDDESGLRMELVHSLLRETLMRSARERGAQTAHHAAVAQALLPRVAAGEPGAAGAVASHLVLAGDKRGALTPLRTASREHVERSEYAQAEAVLDRHAGLLDGLGAPPDDPERLEGVVARADVLRRRGALEPAIELAQGALLAAERGELPSLANHALYVLGHAEVEQGLIVRGRPRLVEAKRRFEAAGDLASASRALRTIGFAHHVRREFADGSVSYLEALELARRAGDRLGMAAALSGMGICDPDMQPGNPIWLEQALAIFSELGNLHGVASTLNNLGDVARVNEDLDEAESLYMRALGSAQNAGASFLEGIVTANLASTRIRRGHFAEAYEELRLGLRRAERHRHQNLLRLLHVLSLAGSAAEGAWEEWDRHEREATRPEVAETRAEPDAAWAAEVAGDIATEVGELVRARSAYTLAESEWRRLDRIDDAVRIAAKLLGLET